MRYMQSRDPRTADGFELDRKFQNLFVPCPILGPIGNGLWIPGVASKKYKNSSPVRQNFQKFIATLTQDLILKLGV